MDARFFCPQSLNGSTVELEGPEAHHLIHVLRLQRGATVELFDGCGTVARAEISAVGRNSVEFRIESMWTATPETAVSVALATAVPKGERFRWLVEKATELGVERLMPLKADRSVVHPGAGKLEKLGQAVVAACKQSGRNHLMQIDPVTDWASLIEHEVPRHRTVVAQPNGRAIGETFGTKPEDRPILLCIGPEGGFTDQELAAAEAAGATFVNLGPRLLRIETAALALTAAVCIALD